ncbi:methylosome subunit pICln-like [Littorina saxatilis]|uniref:Methylosome subunit pICln n=1 Tax=Littorina saxatilis TaxID=31220 RepID=A0AAN9G044_9CAEN
MVLLTNFPPPTDGIRHEQVNTTVEIDGKDFGNGTLIISESCVAWQKESDGLGFSLQYPGISCHAISRDLSSYPHECLYLMLDGKLPDTEPAPDEQEDDDEDSEANISEIRFVPADKTMLQPMYSAMSACQALHPDPEDVDSEEEEFADYNEDDENGEENGYFDSEEGAAHLTPAGRARLAHFDSVIQFAGQGDGPGTANGHHHIIAPSGDGGEAMDMEQFQDADDMD